MFGYFLAEVVTVGSSEIEEIFDMLGSIISIFGVIVFIIVASNVKRAKTNAAKRRNVQNEVRAKRDAETYKNISSASASSKSADEWYDGVKERRAALEQKLKSQTSIEKEMEKRNQSHGHPSVTEKTRVEYVPTGGSLKGESEEGCDEHRNVRFVETDENYSEDIDIDHDLTPLQAMMVFGDVISKPKFKK